LRALAPVVPECSWQIEQHLGPIAEARFLRLITSGELTVIDLTLADYARCIEMIETYADLGLGLVDASVLTVAENLAVTVVVTLNRRDFTVVRPRHCQGLELIP
jgi:predicted nucleic acid-binding protein